MKQFKSLLALVAAIAVSLFVSPPKAEAQITGYNKTVSVTSTNTATSLTTANPRVVIIQNEGQTAIFADFDRVAVASATTVWKIAPCSQLTLTFDPLGNTFSAVHLITSSGTSTARIVAQYATYPFGTVPSPPIERVKLDAAPGCTSTSYESSIYGSGYSKFINAESMTLSTSGATTDSSANLLPADSIIDFVTCRVTVTITTATDWGISDPTSALRFSAVNATMTAGATIIGLKHWFGVVSTTATGPTQASAAKLRITTTGTPGAGAVFCEVYGRTFRAASLNP